MSRNLRTSNKYCSVPQCKNYCTKEIKMHTFPKDRMLKKKWQMILKIGKPITTGMFVCSMHFEEDAYYAGSSSKQKRFLKKNALPTVNIPKGSIKDKKRIERRKLIRKRKTLTIVQEEVTAEYFNKDTENVSEENDLEANLTLLAELASEAPPIKNVGVSIQCNLEDTLIFNIINSNSNLKAFTGVNIDVFNAMVCAVENIMENQNIIIEDTATKILIVLTKLKLNMSYKVLSIFFQKNECTIKWYFVQMLFLLRKAMEDCIYWPTFLENQENLPRCFKKFSKTRVILDCTEIPVQSPRCLKCRCRTYSHYKSQHTIKFLLGIAPCGIISVVSSAYGGRTSDKSIFLKENILSKLEPYVDHVMVDKGFLIEKECAEVGIQMIRPPFLKKQQQLTKLQAKMTAEIARARVHVERAIQRIKLYKIFTETGMEYVALC